MASKAYVLFPVRVTCSYSNNAMFCKIIPAGFMPVGIMSVGPSLMIWYAAWTSKSRALRKEFPSGINPAGMEHAGIMHNISIIFT